VVELGVRRPNNAPLLTDTNERERERKIRLCGGRSGSVVNDVFVWILAREQYLFVLVAEGQW
jgi:hypothetical protein